MMLKDENAIIYGAGGAIGGAVARAFAREGARLFLTGRHLGPVGAVANDIRAAGGIAETAQVDALDEEAVETHATAVLKKAGSIDISLNAITAIPQPGTQGIPIVQLPVESFTAPITAYMRSQFLTARVAARRTVEKKSGVILMNTPEPARLGPRWLGGMVPASAAMEAFNRNLSAEFGSQGIRAVCIRSSGLPETATIDVVFGLHAKALGISREQVQGFVESMTHRSALRRSPRSRTPLSSSRQTWGAE